MKIKLIILLLFIPLLTFSQFGNRLNSKGFQWVQSDTDSTWVEKMAASYCNINSHSTFTETQIDSIKGRLAEVEDVFGPDGLDKSVCDFFMYFQNSNTTTNLTTRTNTKTGATARWDYGAMAYDQNNLPAQTCNGHISVTWTDAATTWTTFDLSYNTFINHLPSFATCTSLQYFYCRENSFSGALPSRLESRERLLWLGKASVEQGPLTAF